MQRIISKMGCLTQNNYCKGSSAFVSLSRVANVKKQMKIHLMKMDPQHNGFLLYRNEGSEFKRNCKILYGLYGAIIVSGGLLLLMTPDFKLFNFLFSLALVLSLVLVIRRNSRTIKQAVLDRKGQKIRITFFGSMLQEKQAVVGVEEMGGFKQVGYFSKTGKISSSKYVSFYFKEQYIRRKDMFKEVFSGRSIKIMS